MKRCLPHSTPCGQDDRQSKNTKEEKTERQKNRKAEKDGETMQNAHLTQPQVDKMTERIFFMLPTP